MATFTCSLCKLEKPKQEVGGTGYATMRNGDLVCYICVANLDRASLIARGDSKALPLYLSGDGRISNWPGTLEYRAWIVREGRHNMGDKRTDVWFFGPDGHIWWGVQIGRWNQILHAKRTKALVPAIAAGRC